MTASVSLPPRPRPAPARRRALATALTTALAGACVGLAHAAPADDGAPDAALRFSGFATLGAAYTRSDAGLRMARDMSDAVHDDAVNVSSDSRLGLQANWTPSPQWEAVAQVVLRDRVKGTPALDALEWAFVAWRPSAEWRLRLGRVAPEMYMHSETRSVGFAHPWVRPSTDFYGWMPLASADGLEASWARATHDTTWRASMFAGRSRATSRMIGGGSVDAVLSRKIGVVLAAEQGPWTVRATASRADVHVHHPRLEQLDVALAALAPLPMITDDVQALRDANRYSMPTTYAAAALQYDDGPWLVQSEWSYVTKAKGLTGGPHAYLSVGRRQGSVTLFGVASFSRTLRGPVDIGGDWASRLAPVLGAEAAAQAQGLAMAATAAANGSRQAERTLSLGARVDVHPRVAWKVQADRHFIDAQGGARWLRSFAQPTAATVFSTSIDTVF